MKILHVCVMCMYVYVCIHAHVCDGGVKRTANQSDKE